MIPISQADRKKRRRLGIHATHLDLLSYSLCDSLAIERRKRGILWLGHTDDFTSSGTSSSDGSLTRSTVLGPSSEVWFWTGVCGCRGSRGEWETDDTAMGVGAGSDGDSRESECTESDCLIEHC